MFLRQSQKLYKLNLGSDKNSILGQNENFVLGISDRLTVGVGDESLKDLEGRSTLSWVNIVGGI